MQTFSPDRCTHRGRTHRKRRHESAGISPTFAAAAAFVAATAFSALGAFPASANPANAMSVPPTSITRSMPEVPRAPLSLQVGKIMALSLPGDATYALTDIEGQLLAGSALKQNPGNKMVRVTARDGLLELEGTREGRVFLSIEAPRQAPQHFALTISKRIVLSDAPITSASTLISPSQTVIGAAPAFSLVSPELSRTAMTPASMVSPTERLTDPETNATRLLLSRIPSVEKPVIARTSALAQVAPVRTSPLSPIAPPLPTLESNEDVDATPAASARAASAPSLPTGIAPLETPAVSTPNTNSTAPLSAESEAALTAAQISPNVPAPTALPAVRIPYRTQASLPDDIARAANDPTSRRPQLTVARGMARILAFRENILAVFFSDENVMDARAINARTLAVTGKGAGRSTLAVMLARTPDDVVGRAVIFNIDVYSPNTAPQVVQEPEVIGFTDPVAARQAIEAAINDPRVTVSVIQRPDGALVARLTGSLRDRAEIEAVATTARLFVPEVISSLYPDVGALTLPEALGNARFSNEGILQSKLRGILNNESIVITALPGGTTLTATVDSAGEAEAILGILPYLDRKIQPIIVVRGAPAASRYYNPERPILFGEDYEMTRRLNEVTGLDSVYAVRTARNALAIYGTVRDRSEYDRLRRYSLLLPQLQEAAASSQSSTTTAAPGTPNAVTNSSAAVTTSVSAAAPALSAAAGVAPVASTRDLTGLRGSNMPVGGYEFPTQIQMFVRVLDENAAAVRLVTVESSVVEIQRDALKDLGVQFGSVGLLSENITAPETTQTIVDGNLQTVTTPGRVERTIDPTFTQGSFLGGNGFIGTGGFANINPIRARVAALYQKGAARVLSNPNLTAVEGSEAQITIGGSRPVPSTTTTAAAGGSNQTSVEFRRFGIILTMRPTVADDDTIILQVRGDVTDLDFTTSISLGGAVIPGERVRSVDTTVTMREGDTLVLGGLITNEHRKQTSKVPFLGDLPFIGKLFQSKRFENNETELAIFLTPSIRRQRGSENLREIIQANPSFPKLPGLQEDSAFELSTVDQGN